MLPLSCSNPQYNDVANIRSLATSGNRADLGHRNNLVLHARYSREWGFGAHRDGPPFLGIALSGGGVRSAAFCVGVLQGLNEQGILIQTDVLTGASGGSYALAWYYSQHAQSEVSGRIDNLLFAQGNPHLRRLAHSARGLTAQTTVSYYFLFLNLLALNLTTVPLRAFENAFDLPHLGTQARDFYQRGILHSYFGHTEPATSPVPPPNRDIEAGRWSARADSNISLYDLAATIKSRHLPYFVVMTTAQALPRRGENAPRLLDCAYEFTPLWRGSDGFGYHEHCPPTDERSALSKVLGYQDHARIDTLSEVIAISGAALDSAQFEIGPCRAAFRRLLGLELGRSVGNYPNGGTPSHNYKNLLPFSYLLSGSSRWDARANYVYLSDAGHSENLAALPLIRRACANILIVDAEHEADISNYAFDAYSKLKKALANELKIAICVPKIDREDCPHCYGKQHSYRPGDIVEGRVLDVPVGLDRSDFHIVYIKLGVDRGDTNLPPEVIEALLPSWCSLFPNEFPMDPTSDQNFDAKRFEAYRALGRSMAVRAAAHLRPKLDLSTSPIPESNQ